MGPPPLAAGVQHVGLGPAAERIERIGDALARIGRSPRSGDERRRKMGKRGAVGLG